MGRFAVIELNKEELKFSAGHFMVLSSSQRESMHGHDYQLHIAFNTFIEHNGMSFDCRLYKQRLSKICESLDYHFILPKFSQFMKIEEQDDKWIIKFATQTIPFLKQDAILLPICNVTLEELSHWFLQQLLVNSDELKQHRIEGITVKVSNGRGESGSSSWGKM